MTERNRPSEVAQALPTPEGNRWGVSLALIGGGSDKEYRIVVTGLRTVFQWGARGAAGQIKVVDHPDSDTALKSARRQWAAKEAKGYWPTSGIVPLDARTTVSTGNHGPQQAIEEGYRSAVDRLRTAGSGDQLWLCQMPGWQSPAPGPTLAGELTRKGGFVVGTAASSGGYALVTADEECGPDLAAACPIAVRVGTLGDARSGTVAEVAETLWRDAGAETANASRLRLASALEMARLLVP